MTAHRACADDELLGRLIRIEEKLDRLLGENPPVAGQAAGLRRMMETRKREAGKPAQESGRCE